jgi:hypothetical protein
MRVSGIIVSTRWRLTDEDVAHLVASDIRHLWRFLSRAECALAHLRTGRVFELHPNIARLVSNCPSHVMKSILGLARDAIAMNENNAVVSTHVDDLSCAEAGASIKPVVGFEFVDLDSLPLIRVHCRCGQFRAGPVWAVNASGLSTVGLVPCRARLLYRYRNGGSLVLWLWFWIYVGRSHFGEGACEVPNVNVRVSLRQRSNSWRMRRRSSMENLFNDDGGAGWGYSVGQMVARVQVGCWRLVKEMGLIPDSDRTVLLAS